MAETRDFFDARTTGGPRKLTEILPPTLASIPRLKPSPSSTTGLPAVPSAPAGRGLSGSGATGRSSGPLSAFGLGPSEAAARLPHLLAQHIVWGEKSILGPDGQFEGVDITGVAVRHGAVVPQEARQAIADLCQPCTPEWAAKALAHMRALTSSRAKDNDDMEIAAVAYTARLAEYPQDVVAAACRAWTDREKWWPSWAELQAELDKRMRGRRALQRALG